MRTAVESRPGAQVPGNILASIRQHEPDDERMYLDADVGLGSRRLSIKVKGAPTASGRSLWMDTPLPPRQACSAFPICVSVFTQPIRKHSNGGRETCGS